MHWRTKLVQSDVKVRQDFRSLVPAVHRGSTVVFDRVSDVIDDWRQAENGYSYGLYGTPTTLELAARVCELERGHRTFVVPGGQAAIAAIYLAFCSSGSHALVPITAYGPNREMSLSILSRLRIEVEAYDPLIGAGISELIRDNTTLIWTESPGSVTMEVQDVPAIVAAAHAKNVPVALDNTYAAGIMFDAFAHGVDISMQALTKYIGGHSDLLLGTITGRNEAIAQLIGSTLKQLGMAVSPDDCSLALRGLQTLGVRLSRLESSALEVARWLNDQPKIKAVLHPALPSCPGHEFWARDFTGSTSVFSVEFSSEYTAAQVASFVESLKYFKIGMSWGGTASLALVYPTLDRPGKDYAGRLVRFNIGLEEPSDLISDLQLALNDLRRD
jgi:cystathionine beta-lyase